MKETIKIYGKFKGRTAREKAFMLKRLLLDMEGVETYITREFLSSDVSTPWYFVKGEQK